MTITVELSLYPLDHEFEGPIISFIKSLKSSEDVEVFTHSMSSYIRGESGAVFNAINKSLKSVGDQTDTMSLVMKIVNRPLYPEKGFFPDEKI
ncbi:MAG: hypothetical protein HKN67_09860 [Saprospiraceae bacterium]|nr:hypothetical protein [Saprospiraceae bacterium]